MTKIISAFPTFGKTYYAKKYPNDAIDLESGVYWWMKTGFEDLTPEQFKGLPDRIKNPKAMEDYIEAIVNTVESKIYKYVFIHRKIETIENLTRLGYEVVFLKPSPTLESEEYFIKKATLRGNDTVWIQKTKSLIFENVLSRFSERCLSKIKIVEASLKDNIETLINQNKL